VFDHERRTQAIGARGIVKVAVRLRFKLPEFRAGLRDIRLPALLRQLGGAKAQQIGKPFGVRFEEPDVLDLMEAINTARLRVWSQQPVDFFGEAIVDLNGSIVGTDAECKEDIDISYNGVWGYHVLVVSLANTGEPLDLVNRSGNRPSHEQAHVFVDKTIDLCRRAGFERTYLRGDTDFSQTTHLDRWDAASDVRFLFGIDAHPTLKAIAMGLPASAYSVLARPPGYVIKTEPRERPERVKPEIVKQRGYETIHLLEEMVAEFAYRPIACDKDYRLVVLRKRVGIDKGSVRLREE
jgi:hypothetical protein